MSRTTTRELKPAAAIFIDSETNEVRWTNSTRVRVRRSLRRLGYDVRMKGDRLFVTNTDADRKTR